MLPTTDPREATMLALDRLKIFPLPASVLIPRGYLPLHVFEPRYRDMIADCLAHDRVLAVATLAPGWETNYEGRPAVLPVMGVGFVENDERLANGRFNILLHGVLRARMLDEHAPTHSYREIRAAVLSEIVKPDDRGDIEALGVTLRRLVLDLVAALPNSTARPLARSAAGERDPSALADIVGAAVLTDADQRQRFLEELDLKHRLDLAIDRVSQMLLQVSQPMGGEA